MSLGFLIVKVLDEYYLNLINKWKRPYHVCKPIAEGSETFL